MIGLILLIVSSVLKWLLTPLAYIYGIIISIKKREFNDYNMKLAIAKDQYGNCLCRYLFNQILIVDGGYKFGNIDETISSVVGKNKRNGTLTKIGKILDYCLDKFEKDHSIKSIDETIK